MENVLNIPEITNNTIQYFVDGDFDIKSYYKKFLDENKDKEELFNELRR